ncbi:MAG: outer membrane lipid asymmetry maintenance protein MlaD [Nitrospinae bacterium]|nr:outer membrane lipid asymmetry maintenance protein MlaD [Nitrospinota bacterium]
MRKLSTEAIVGVFVLMGIFSLVYISLKLGKLEIMSSDYYTIFADFENASGVREGADIELAGVIIGRVEKVLVHNDMARLALRIRKDIKLTNDTIASIKTRGLIGEKILKLNPGGSDTIVKPGGVLNETESTVDLEELISKYIFGGV